MKKLFLGICLISASQFAFAQKSKPVATKKTTTTKTSKNEPVKPASPEYEKAMTAGISKLQNSHSSTELVALANDFSRIAAKEKMQWLPSYYAALATLQNGRMMMQDPNRSAELDEIADLADKYIAQSEALSPMNAELFILKKMSHSIRMMVNPMARFMTEGTKAKEMLDTAKKLDPTNPRILLLEAEDTYFTPEQFGGSKDKGLEMLKKSLELFKNYKVKTNLDPNWGKSEAEMFLKQGK